MKKQTILRWLAALSITLTVALFELDYRKLLAEEEPGIGPGIAMVVYTIILLCEMIFWRSILVLFSERIKTRTEIVLHSFFVLGALFFLVCYIAREFTGGALHRFFRDLFPMDRDLYFLAGFLALRVIGGILLLALTVRTAKDGDDAQLTA